MGSKNDHVARLSLYCLQNLVYWVAKRNEGFGYNFNTWKCILNLNFSAKSLQVFFDLLKVHLLFIFFEPSQVNTSQTSYNKQNEEWDE